MATLHLEITIKPTPFDDWPRTPYDTWCAYAVTYKSVENGMEMTLLESEWDFMPLFTWFTENVEAFRQDQFEILGINGTRPTSNESLAQTLTRLYEADFEDEDFFDRYYDALQDYRKQHDLSWGLSGTVLPKTIIGINRGHGEISVDEEEKGGATYACSFDMELFIESLHATFKKPLSQWRDSTSNMEVHTFIAALENKLRRMK